MIRKILIVLVMLVAARLSLGATINWQTDASATSGIVDEFGAVPTLTWAVVLYQDTDTVLPSQLYFGGLTSDSSSLVTSNSTALVNLGSFGYLYDVGYTDSGLGLSIGSYIFTVVFNNADVNSATKYAIVDNAVFTIPNYGLNPSFTYDIGATVAGDWKDLIAVPEPGTMGLMLIGGAVFAARARRKKRADAVQS